MVKLLLTNSLSAFLHVGDSLTKLIPSSKRKPGENINFSTSELVCLTEVPNDGVSGIIGNRKNSSAGWEISNPV